MLQLVIRVCKVYFQCWFQIYTVSQHNMMTSSNGTFSALLALCAGNSPVTGEFPAQRPVAQSFGVFFDLRLNKRLSKQPWGWWSETPSRSLWRHCNGAQDYYYHQYSCGRYWADCNIILYHSKFVWLLLIWNMFAPNWRHFSKWPTRSLVSSRANIHVRSVVNCNTCDGVAVTPAEAAA